NQISKSTLAGKSPAEINTLTIKLAKITAKIDAYSTILDILTPPQSSIEMHKAEVSACQH
ncbi:MAG: hypothetical protein HUJ13_03925, partial [Hydrogenovibrio crunogenus]|nr:hypothetical protein [Hydrogenovibrio crunogenus]